MPSSPNAPRRDRAASLRRERRASEYRRYGDAGLWPPHVRPRASDHQTKAPGRAAARRRDRRRRRRGAVPARPARVGIRGIRPVTDARSPFVPVDPSRRRRRPTRVRRVGGRRGAPPGGHGHVRGANPGRNGSRPDGPIQSRRHVGRVRRRRDRSVGRRRRAEPRREAQHVAVVAHRRRAGRRDRARWRGGRRSGRRPAGPGEGRVRRRRTWCSARTGDRSRRTSAAIGS